MRAAGTGRTSTYGQAAGELGLAGGRERRAFFVTDADPFYVAAANRVSQRIKRVANQCENVLDSDLFEHADQDVCYRLGHPRLLARYPAPCSTLYSLPRCWLNHRPRGISWGRWPSSSSCDVGLVSGDNLLVRSAFHHSAGASRAASPAIGIGMERVSHITPFWVGRPRVAG